VTAQQTALYHRHHHWAKFERPIYSAHRSVPAPWPSRSSLRSRSMVFSHARSPLHSRSLSFRPAPLRFPPRSRSAHLLWWSHPMHFLWELKRTGGYYGIDGRMTQIVTYVWYVWPRFAVISRQAEQGFTEPRWARLDFIQYLAISVVCRTCYLITACTIVHVAYQSLLDLYGSGYYKLL